MGTSTAPPVSPHTLGLGVSAQGPLEQKQHERRGAVPHLASSLQLEHQRPSHQARALTPPSVIKELHKVIPCFACGTVRVNFVMKLLSAATKHRHTTVPHRSVSSIKDSRRRQPDLDSGVTLLSALTPKSGSPKLSPTISH